MYITLEIDYAVRIVDYIIKHPPRSAATEICAATGVPTRFAMKILGKLSAKGIVCSYRGTGGGYEITGEPKNITLYAVVEAAGGDYLFSRCLGNGYCCERGGELPCTYREVFMEVTDKVREVLESKTFDNL